MRKAVVIALVAMSGCGKTVLELGVDGGPGCPPFAQCAPLPGSAGTGGSRGTGGFASTGGQSIGAGGQSTGGIYLGTGGVTMGGSGTGGAVTNVITWPGNASDCPASPPQGASVPITTGTLGDVCNLAEGTSCAYWYDQGGNTLYRGCTCYERTSTDRRWACDDTSGQNACPMTQPADGSDCWSHVGTECPFPVQMRCSCPLNDPNAKWSCISHAGFSGATGINLSGPSDTSAFAKSIKDLSSAEASTWCGWFSTYLGVAGAPPPRAAPVGADGYVTVGATYNWDFFGEACVATGLEASQCVANLQLLGCEATLGELTDCVLTVGKGTPQPHGCGPFFASAHCDGTIVRRAALTATGGSGAGGGGFAGSMNPNPEANCGSLRVR